MNVYDVLQKPVVSEKSNELKDAEGKYVFYVHMDATKLEIRGAVKKIFDVDATKISTSILRGKMKRKGMNFGMTKKRKKAVVTLAAGQNIKMFEES